MQGGQWREAREARAKVDPQSPPCVKCAAARDCLISGSVACLSVPSHGLQAQYAGQAVPPDCPSCDPEGQPMMGALPLQAKGAYTKVGTWAPTETDAEVIEMMADKDEEWEASLAGKDEWINRPAQPPGLLRSGAHSA